MIEMTSQITGVSDVCWTFYPAAGQKKHQSSASLVFVRGIRWWLADSPHKGPVTRKMFPFDNVINEMLTNGISIKFQIRPNFAVLWFKTCSTDRNEILHTSQKLHCHVACAISLWSAKYILNQSTAKFGRISNSIEISLVGRAPYLLNVEKLKLGTNKNLRLT